jgi:hypothetical protein
LFEKIETSTLNQRLFMPLSNARSQRKMRQQFWIHQLERAGDGLPLEQMPRELIEAAEEKVFGRSTTLEVPPAKPPASKAGTPHEFVILPWMRVEAEHLAIRYGPPVEDE